MSEDRLAELHQFAPGIKARMRSGGGEAVLWVHGYTVNSSIWDQLWTMLPDWTHIGIDLPGHGHSDSLTPGTDLRDLGEQLAAAALDWGVRHVVGLSLGSMIALQVVLARPQAFATLTLGAPSLAGGPIDSGVGIRYRELRALYLARGPGPWMTELWMRAPPDTFAHSSELLDRHLAAIVDGHSWEELEDYRRGIALLAQQRQDPAALATSAVRLLLLVGEHEFPAFRETAHILQSLRPESELVELPGVGHLCMLQAQESCAAILADHWRRGPAD